MDCVTALVKDIEDVHAFGQLLGVTEENLAAIESYYEHNEQIIRHMVTLWLIQEPDDPVTQLRDALNALERHQISQNLVLLASLGNHS